MQYGLHVGPVGELADVRTLIRLAEASEAAGWDGFFLWDHLTLGLPDPVADPWVALTAVALHTERLRLGPLVTPLARRHPAHVAHETVTLDHLSGGRLILGVGLGDIPHEFEYLGEPANLRVRAARLDEALAVLTGLWSGAPFTYHGTHYQVQEEHFTPPPLQTPRIPIWVAGFWPRRAPFRRAARWDGVFAGKVGLAGDALLSLTDLQAIHAFIAAERSQPGSFDVVLGGATSGEDPAETATLLAAYAAGGATWWLEHIHPWRGSLAEMEARIRQGPPR
jgi:alkanesulfonate monooxygenase SsuD/methylene tetrahydromethanopterin reductase-like flavin-dependent oxidoreductase (luciferase family)